MNGLDLLRMMRNDQELKFVRVLVSSGMELSKESYQDGADGFIMKPYMPDDLVATIRATIAEGCSGS